MTLSTATGFFVTGTDTEVGKTLVSGALILKLREAGIRTVGFKPVVAGTYVDAGGQKLNEDIETLHIASGLNSAEHSLCSFVLDEAAAPHLVAQSHGIHLDATIILDQFNALASEFDSVVVEGAGGFLVPLNEQEDLGDVAQAMDLPVILVVGMRLGCINHALLTCEAIQSRQLTIAGWVANTLSD
jgi:dethiobiotin synthetase